MLKHPYVQLITAVEKADVQTSFYCPKFLRKKLIIHTTFKRLVRPKLVLFLLAVWNPTPTNVECKTESIWWLWKWKNLMKINPEEHRLILKLFEQYIILYCTQYCILCEAKTLFYKYKENSMFSFRITLTSFSCLFLAHERSVLSSPLLFKQTTMFTFHNHYKISIFSSQIDI